MTYLIASTSPLLYSDRRLSKTKQSLQSVTKLNSIPLKREHNGPIVGVIRNLSYRLINGVGCLFGDTDAKVQGGLSMQYQGKQRGNQITITEVDHVAITDNPRDQRTIFSDSDPKLITYQDSADAPVDTTPDTPTDTPEDAPPDTATDTPDTTPEAIEVEITDGLLDALITRLTTDDGFKSSLLDLITPVVEPKEETKTRVFVKPVSVNTQVAPIKPRSIQQPFRPL